MQEKLLLRFDLPMIQSYGMIQLICTRGYRETGNKFSVFFNGSKGYLSNIEITCEGCQTAENRIFVDQLTNKNRSLRKVLVNIFYSDQNGVRVAIGKNALPQFVAEQEPEPISCNEEEDGDLPF